MSFTFELDDPSVRGEAIFASVVEDVEAGIEYCK